MQNAHKFGGVVAAFADLPSGISTPCQFGNGAALVPLAAVVDGSTKLGRRLGCRQLVQGMRCSW